jgi:cell division protein FtsQ
MSLDSHTLPVVPPELGNDQHPSPSNRYDRWHPSRKVIILWSVVSVLVVVGLAWLFSWSSPVPIREIKVVGADEDSVAQILTAAELVEGTSMRDVDLARIEERVLAVPGIQGVAVELERPWTVAVVVAEKFPFAQTQTGDTFQVLDSSGGVIRESSKVNKKLPLVVASPEMMGSTLEILEAFPEELLDKVGAAIAKEPGSYSVWLRGGTVVALGSEADVAEKAGVILSLTALSPKTINVSVPSRPAVTGQLKLPKKNTEPASPAKP